jgi:uroporphyrinogen decarboxylase
MSGKEMNSYERCMASLNLEEPDRVPVTSLMCTIAAKWAPAYVADFVKSGELMAKGFGAAHDKFHFDFLDAYPDVGRIPEAWGCNITYVEKSYDVTPYISGWCVQKPEDWETLQGFDPEKKKSTAELYKSMEILNKKYGNTVLWATESSSPITTSTHLRKMSDTLVDLAATPDLLHKGLKTITKQWIDVAKGTIKHGANAILQICTRATADLLMFGQYLEFGWPYEEDFLREMAREFPDAPRLIHVCGDEPYLEAIAEHSIQGFNYYDRGLAKSPLSGFRYSLDKAKEKFGDRRTLIAGIDQNKTAIIGDEIDIMSEARDAILTAAKGGGYWLAGGCDLPPQMSDEKVMALSKAAEKWGTYPIKWSYR